MSENQSTPLTFQEWWEEWNDISKKKFSFNDATKALDQLERVIEQYLQASK